MYPFVKYTLRAVSQYGLKFKNFIYLVLCLFVLFFVYTETSKRLIPIPLGEEIEVTQSPPPKNLAEEKVDVSKSPQPEIIPTQQTSKKLPHFDPWKEARDYQDLSGDPVFPAFTDWVKEFTELACAEPGSCADHDPRYIRNFVLHGERLSRTRAEVLNKIIIGDPKSAIRLAIPERTAEILPSTIKKNLEKWESTFADIKSAHSCFSPDHQGCEIRRVAKFKDNRAVRLWTYGKRKAVNTINNLAVWGVSIGDDFAMADTPIREFPKNGYSGVAKWGGRSLTYETEAEFNYFSYLVEDAERRAGSIQGIKSVEYPVAMGSSNAMGAVLRSKYTVVSTPQPFMTAYEDAISKGGTLLKIESQEENDFICQLVQGNVFKGAADPTEATVPWIWLGATDDENQSGIIYDLAQKKLRDINISAKESTWKWLDGQPVDEGTFWNFPRPLPAPFDERANHAFLNYVTGEWNATRGPFPAGPRSATKPETDPNGKVQEITIIGSPFTTDPPLWDNFPPDPNIVYEFPGSSLPYVIEKRTIVDHGRSQDISLKGIRKVLVIPGRYKDETEEYFYPWQSKPDYSPLLSNALGEPIDPELRKRTFTPISTSKLVETMNEVKEFFYNTTDQELELVPIFAPTVTIPEDITTAHTEFAGSASDHDSNGTHTGGALWVFSPYADLSIFAEQAKEIAAQESEEYDFYGPAFVGIANIEVNATAGFTGDPNGYEIPPQITITGGSYINPVTGLPHVRHEPAKAEAVLDSQGRIIKIKLTETGSYYFDPNFGHNYDSFGRNIFDYNYTEDDQKPEEDRSPLHGRYRDLCVILDSDDDGVAEYNTVKPTILINGDSSFTDDFSIEVDNVCITWIVLTNYSFGAEYDGESDSGDGVEEYNASSSPGTAWVGAPGAHITITTDDDGERSASSRTIAHEIGHNLGLWHDQSYISKGEHALSDESIKVEYGNPYTIMGSGDIALGAHFSLPAQTTLFEIFNGGAGFSSGNAQGVDVLEINSSADLNVSLKELNAPNPNTFRIYRNNFFSPPRSLRESNFTVRFPDDDKDQNISWFVNELLGDPNGTKTAHENNSTASDKDLNITLLVLGSGEDANVSLSFSNQSLPRMEVHQGGKGFFKEPTFIIKDPNSTTTLIIDPSWITEENSNRIAEILDPNESAIWIRGIRIATDAGGGGNFLPRGFSVDDNLSEYYLSYRTDSSLYGINLLLANDPRGQFLPDRETFLVDCTPNTPNDFRDAALLVGSTYSDYDSDIHITPVRWGGGAPLTELDVIRTKIADITTKRDSLTDILGEDGSIFYQEFQDELTELYKQQQALELDSYPYMEVVINIGSMSDGSAQAPQFDFFIDNEFPQTGEFIQLAAIPTTGDSKDYAYSWYVNEQRLEEPAQLNQPTNFLAFNEPGRRVIRVLVSDMKGGVSSKTKIIQVSGGEILHNDSLVSGTVHSTQGAIQGARVVIEQAPLYEHSLNIEGTLKDSYFSTGLNNPLQLRIDNEISPTLEFHRGEIHRFYFSEYFDQAQDFSKFVFLEKPEGSPPRVSVNLIADPHRSKTKFGGLYVRNPEIVYEMNASFNPYLSDKVIPFSELTNPHNQLGSGTPAPSIDQATVITRPYAKALMEESNISYGRVGPMEINEFGYYVFGGKAYSREKTPAMQVRRVSIWEDYSDRNATARANIDGVGTISPINAVNPVTGLTEFMGQTWRTRLTDDVLPEIIVWGSGGDESGEEPVREVNTTIIKGKETNRYITTINQGQGYEPDGTMAVLHYPIEPYAYWTFDRHESLFENNQSGRYQPSPVWNRQFFFNDLLHRWTFDELNGSVVANIDKDLNFTIPFATGLVSNWGLKGRALDWNATPAPADSQEVSFLGALPDDNVTVSFWARPQQDFNVTLGDNDISLNFDFDLNKTIFKRNLGGANLLEMVRANPQYNKWVHFAVTTNRRTEELSVYVDGRKDFISGGDFNFTGDLNISHFKGLIDELLIFDKALEEPAIKYLAGRTYLDLSGNKYHLSPMSENLVPITPGQSGSSADVPSDFSLLPEAQAATTPEERYGKLGDTFIQENSGHSLRLNGNSDYLDLSSHKDEFALAEGTISLWVKTPQFYNENLPLLWLSKPFFFTDINVTDPVSGNSTIVRSFDPGQYFSLDIFNGWPRIAGYQVLGSSNKINLTGEWKHLAATFPGGKFWIDGEEVPSGLYDSTGNIFDSMTNPLEFMSEADTFWVGKALDVDDYTVEHHYSGGIDDLAIYNRILTNEEVLFLYELRRGREQIPRLEAVVDAVGTVDILDQGEGYRENPKLVFGFGSEMDRTKLSIRENNFSDLILKHDETNTAHGDLALVLNNAQGDPINRVYSFHMGADPGSNLTYQNQWRKSGTANGWRRLVPAQGIGEYENAALGDVVWTKRLSNQTEIPLPDGNTSLRRYVEYVTDDIDHSSFSEVNETSPATRGYWKPNGLYGFIQVPDLKVSPPGEHNSEINEQESEFFTAEAYVLYLVDRDANDSTTIVDAGSGFKEDAQSQFNNGSLEVKISGKGYRPPRFVQESKGRGASYTILQHEQWEDPLEPLDGDDAAIFYNGTVSAGPGYLAANWVGSHDLGISNMEFNQSLAKVIIDDPGYGYATPVELRSWGGYPELGYTNSSGIDIEAIFGPDGFGTDLVLYFEESLGVGRAFDPTDPVQPITYRDAIFKVTEVDENGSITKIEMTDAGTGYRRWWRQQLFFKGHPTFSNFPFGISNCS
jgi:hypothetical protein